MEKPVKIPVFQALTGSELEANSGHAVWIDSRDEASTYALRQHGGPEIMSKVDIGRAFTPLQHHNLVQKLEKFIQEETSLLVLPNIDFHYFDGQLSDWEAEELFQETWEKVIEVQERFDLKVVISFIGSDRPEYLVNPDIDNRIKVESTEQGLKYDTEDFDQFVYREGKSYQTTMPYWNEKSSQKVKIDTEATI